MRQDRGGVASLGREPSPGTEPAVRPTVRLVPGGAVGEVIDADRFRALRPRRAGRLRRQLAWSRIAGACLGLELMVAGAAGAYGFFSEREGIMTVALAWALVQIFGTAFGRCGRTTVTVVGTAKRAQVTGMAVLAFVAAGLLTPVVAGWFLALVGVSLGLRGVAAVAPGGARATTRVMIVGRSHEIPTAVTTMAAAGAEVSTYCVSDADPLTRGEHLHRAVLESAPDRVLVLGGTMNARELQEMSWAIEDYAIELVVGMADGHIDPRRFEPVNDHGVRGMRLTPRKGLRADAALGLAHRVGAGILLVVLAPVMLVVAAMVRFDSSGPALFIQRRVGRNGREFPMVKFRTMHVDAEKMLDALMSQNESEDGVLFKMKGDPRITRVGRVLRATSLDELPQLFNVVRGEMALIGPRPALPREVAEYDHRARRRLAVRPGMTGLWQVSGRSNLSFNDAVRLDIDYVDNWSLRREAEIAVRTVGAVVQREGAY